MQDRGRYIDDDAYEAYLDNDGQEVLITKLLPVPPRDAFDSWLEHCWTSKGELLRKGQGRGKVGSVRKMGLGIVEEIIAAGVPDTDSNGSSSRAIKRTSDDRAIPSISYVIRESPLPLQSHLGYVRFIPDQDGRATLVAWSVKNTPTMVGHVICCGGSILRMAFRSVLTRFLDSLLSYVRRR